MKLKDFENLCASEKHFYYNQHRLEWSNIHEAWVDYPDEPDYSFTNEELSQLEVVAVEAGWSLYVIVHLGEEK